MEISSNTVNVNKPNVAPKVDTNEADKVNPEEVQRVNISSSADDMNQLFKSALSVAKGNRTPPYIGIEKRTQIVKDSVLELAKNTGVEYTDKQINRIVDDVKDAARIIPIRRNADPYALSGSSNDFLTNKDISRLAEAYQYALDNGTDPDDLSYPAHALGAFRHQEAMINGGTRCWVQAYDPENPTENGTDAWKKDREDFHNNTLYADNPHLSEGFLHDVMRAEFTDGVPEFLKGKLLVEGTPAAAAAMKEMDRENEEYWRNQEKMYANESGGTDKNIGPNISPEIDRFKHIQNLLDAIFSKKKKKKRKGNNIFGSKSAIPKTGKSFSERLNHYIKAKEPEPEPETKTADKANKIKTEV